jgi:hypothetical protein
MPIEALIILVVTVLALVVGIIFMFAKSYFPPFKHYKEGGFNNVKARIWAETPEILELIDAKAVAKAAWCVQAAWRDLEMKDMVKVREAMSEVAVVATTVDSFQKWAYFSYKTAASVMVWTKDKFWNRSIPMCVIHENTLTLRGSDVSYPIHEYIHAAADKALGGTDPTHQNLELWQALSKKANEYYERY